MLLLYRSNKNWRKITVMPLLGLGTLVNRDTTARVTYGIKTEIQSNCYSSTTMYLYGWKDPKLVVTSYPLI